MLFPEQEKMYSSLVNPPKLSATMPSVSEIESCSFPSTSTQIASHRSCRVVQVHFPSSTKSKK